MGTKPQDAGKTAEETTVEMTRIRQAELAISWVLRGGVLASAAITLLGVLLFYARWLRFGAKHVAVAPFPHSLLAVALGLRHGDPLAVIALGLLVLLATPLARVALSVVTFARERDWLYTGITLAVLAILLISFLLGKGGG